MHWTDWPYIVAAVLVWVGAVMLLQRGLWWDRGSGRRRCGGCWYDMEKVPGLRCPECGRAARSERGLHRARRRWRPLGLAAAASVIGICVYLWPVYHRSGWMGVTPTWTFITIRQWAPATWQPGGIDEWIEWRLRDDVSDDQAWAWQIMWKARRDLASKVTTRPWPKGVPIYVACDTILPWDDDVSTNTLLVYTTSDDHLPFDHVSLAALDSSSPVTLRVMRYDEATDAPKRFYGEVPLDITIVDSMDDAMTPVEGAEANDALRARLRNVGLVGNRVREGDAMPMKFVDVTFAYKVEVIRAGEVIATWRCTSRAGEYRLLDNDGDVQPAVAEMQYPDQIAGDTVVRVTSDPELALRDFGSKRYWKGAFTSPLKDFTGPLGRLPWQME